jgi:diguanylate cyclase (GGDEF)-like protein
MVYVTAAFVMLQSVVTGTLRITRGDGLVLVLAGLVVNAIAFVWWTPLLITGTYVSGGTPLDALWTVGMVLVGVGAATAQPPAAVEDVEQVSHRRGAVLPSITFALLALVQAVLILRDAPAGAELVLCLGVALSGAMLGVRASTLRREQMTLVRQLERRENELRDVNTRLSRESRLDALTGLGNRLRLDEDLTELASQAERHGRSYCLILCDLDRFKDYNDALGHQAGDQALRQVAEMLAQRTRGEDRVYRYGGEELLLILPDQDAREGAEVAERHRAGLEQAAIPHPASSSFGVVTLSAGVAAAEPGDTVRQVLRRADAALYRAKCDGRNQVAVAPPGHLGQSAIPAAGV